MWVYFIIKLITATSEQSIPCPAHLAGCAVYHFEMRTDTVLIDTTWYCERSMAFFSAGKKNVRAEDSPWRITEWYDGKTKTYKWIDSLWIKQ